MKNICFYFFLIFNKHFFSQSFQTFKFLIFTFQLLYIFVCFPPHTLTHLWRLQTNTKSSSSTRRLQRGQFDIVVVRSVAHFPP